MFYDLTLKDTIRIDPKLFSLPLEEAVLKELNARYLGYVSQEMGIVVGISSVGEVSEGKIIPEDGATYHQVAFSVITFIPEMKEVVLGIVRKIEEFGVFFDMGPIDGMIHISQTMDDFVSFSKDNALQGKESKKVLKPGDLCRAKIIAISFKDIENIKIGLTMRQPTLGKPEWAQEEA
jgi:DNA-directed RNA polymerase subunit E'